ncbi:MAG: carboxy-S-adenosyl-L-methionine synthase CmoA [bacterium]|nr:carboxy-S-adenosyl-L-methionine synthase CmoA [Gammaproteobacteria bacterium]HIL94851.1 carboxy-S-adenosyl-L-methionine synthase CmoA [Pseudomonadales bacterium]
MNKDKVYAAPIDQVADFSFDAKVADVFENMINRSVPGYALMLDLIGVITEKYVVPGTNCYDLGCSLGASTLKLRQHLPASCHLVGVDNSAAMVERCRANIERDHSQASIEILEQRLQDTQIENASIVVINFTLQFIPDDERQKVLDSIARGMIAGGVLILAEKIKFDDKVDQASMMELHHEFKKYQGYSDLEVAQKRAALEKVLVPNTEQQHIDRLIRAGFQSAQLTVRCLNFASFLAVR